MSIRRLKAQTAACEERDDRRSQNHCCLQLLAGPEEKIRRTVTYFL